MARLGFSFCRKREVTEGGGVIRNVLEPSGISGGGTGLRSLPAANRGASRGEAQANRKVRCPHALPA